VSREQKATKEILNTYKDYDENLFNQSVKMALKRKELDKLKELGAAIKSPEADMRFLQGQISELRAIQVFAEKHKEDLMKR